MIRINLLPFRAARKKENIRRQVSIFLLSLAFMLIILFYFNFSLSSKIGNLNTSIKDTQSELEKYAKINKEIDNIKKKLDNLKKKNADYILVVEPWPNELTWIGRYPDKFQLVFTARKFKIFKYRGETT